MYKRILFLLNMGLVFSLHASEGDCLKSLVQSVKKVRNLALDISPYNKYELPNIALTALDDYLSAEVKELDEYLERALFIDQDLNAFHSRNSFRVRRNNGGQDLINVFNAPFVADGQAYVNFKPWRVGDHDYIGTQDNVIRRMPLKDMYELVHDDFFSSHIKKNDIVIIRTNGTYRPYVFHSHDEKSAYLYDLKGKKVEFSKIEVFVSNFYIDPAERELLNLFFHNGGEGEVYYVEETVVGLTHLFGFYIKVTKAASFASLGDKVTQLYHCYDSFEALNKMIDEGKSILLTTENHNIRAGFASKNSLYSDFIPTTDEGHLVITRYSTPFDLKHELRHQQDHIEGIFASYRNEFENLQKEYQVEESKLPQIIWLDFERYIKEQRAYSTQRKLIEKALIENPEMPFYYQRDGINPIHSLKDYYDHFNDYDLKLFANVYVYPLRRSLLLVKNENEELFKKVIKVIQKYVISDPYFNGNARP